jgi:signal transduction histidine kinase
MLPSNKTVANEQINHVIDSLKQTLTTQQLSEKQKMKTYLDIGYQFQNFEQDSAIFYITKCIMLAQKFKEDEKLMESFISLGVSYCFKGDFELAFSYFNQSKELAIKYGNKQKESTAIRFTAYIYAKQGKFNTALDNYFKFVKICEDEGWTNDRGYIGALTNISEINRRLGNTETAILYLKKAEEALKIDSLNGYLATHIWNEYAFNYLKQGDLEKALYYAFRTDRVGSYVVNQCYAKGILATIYLQQKDNNRALEYAKESFEWAEILQDINLYAYAGKILSDVYLALKRYPEAETEALKVWQRDSTNMDESRGVVENIVLANIYMRNMEKAAYYLKKYSELNAQYSEKSFQTTVSDLAIKYETEKKEIRIAALEDEKKFYTWLVIACATILLLAIGLLLIGRRMDIQKRKLLEQQRKISDQKVKQLEQEQQLIATQAVLDGETAERSRLARDLHDGLGGMLSVVKLNLNDMKHSAIMDGADVEHLGKALEMLDQSIGELRRVAHHIMPESLLRYGLKVSLDDFCRAVPGAHFQYLGEDSRLDSRLEVLIYRCAYELINNAVKHAHATTIHVQIIMDNSIISLTVQDNGVGFNPQTVNSGIGLENIRTRIAVYNGKMAIHTSPDNGTEICIEIEML